VSQLYLGLAQLALAIVLSAVAAYLAFYLFQVLTRNLDEGKALSEGNAAVGLVLGATVVAVAIVLRPALWVDTSTWDVGKTLIIKALVAEAVHLLIGLVFAVVTLALAILIFAGLTRGIDEVKELENGNLAIGALLAGVVIGVGLMVSQATTEVIRQVSALLF
jgi:uncharacterized membrane protein YjfL (UPF0719 family)